MALRIDSFQKVEQEAYKLISRFGVYHPPVPIEEIVKNLAITLIPYDLGDEVSGVCVLNGGICTIGFNSKHNKNRQRFTIAHELAHYIFHREDESFFVDKDFLVKYRSDKNYNAVEIRQEQQANAFAAAILMPKEFIINQLSKKEYKDLSETDLVNELADLFNVSILAMTYRLSNIMQYSENWQ